MKTYLKHKEAWVALALVSCLIPVAAQEPAAGTATTGSTTVAKVKDLRSIESAREIIGQNLASNDGATLGQLQDLAVDPKDGRIVYGLVASGGVLGIGEHVRAVPFNAFGDEYSPDGSLTIDVDQTKWEQVPVLGDDPIASLRTPSVVEATSQVFGGKPNTDRAGESRAAQPALMLVTALTGKKLMSGNDEAGEIDDVIVNLEKGRAAALLDPNDDYTGSDRKLIIGFGQISVQGPEQPLVTNLTREQLKRATPSAVDWWIASTPGPYVWSDNSRSAVIGDGQDRRVARTATESIRGRRTAQVISGAVSLSQEISDHARRNVSVEEQGGRLIVSGKVESQKMKQKVAEVVASAAEGKWDIDNRLTVQSATE